VFCDWNHGPQSRRGRNFGQNIPVVARLMHKRIGFPKSMPELAAAFWDLVDCRRPRHQFAGSFSVKN